jgi:hypothetical protein
MDDPEIMHVQLQPWFLTKAPKTYIGEKTASLTKGAGKTGYPHVGDWN